MSVTLTVLLAPGGERRHQRRQGGTGRRGGMIAQSASLATITVIETTFTETGPI